MGVCIHRLVLDYRVLSVGPTLAGLGAHAGWFTASFCLNTPISWAVSHPLAAEGVDTCTPLG